MHSKVCASRVSASFPRLALPDCCTVHARPVQVVAHIDGTPRAPATILARVGKRAATTEDGRRADDRPERARPTLRILYDGRGVAHEPPLALVPGHHRIGRDVQPSEGITLHDSRASRTHATLHVAARTLKVRLTDEGSRNGTWVNGAPIDECWLDDGDILRLADTHLLLRFDPPSIGDAEVPSLMGGAPSMRALRGIVARVAEHDVTVLLCGETGTGKEVVARALHDRSRRRGPFVAVNCAAIPEPLAESELFGHVAGAFTGATSNREGLFRAANQGTTFLDEIGDLPIALQPKLLRVLEQRRVTSVGATGDEAVDVRVVAATNVDLAKAVASGAFRGDLYARLAEFSVALPPLRERREDVLVLLEHTYDGVLPALEPDLVAALLAHAWPYNVRELRAVARELSVRGEEGRALGLELVAHRLGSSERAPSVGPRATEPVTSTTGLDRAAPPSREELTRILQECRGNIRAIARKTGRSRMQVYRWLEQYELDLARYRDS